jgi:hypothetical protein
LFEAFGVLSSTLLPSPHQSFLQIRETPTWFDQSHNIFAKLRNYCVFLNAFWHTQKTNTIYPTTRCLFFMHFCIRKRYITHLLYLTLGLVLSLINPLNIEIKFSENILWSWGVENHQIYYLCFNMNNFTIIIWQSHSRQM